MILRAIFLVFALVFLSISGYPSELETLKQEYEKLKKDYEAVLQDRDNLFVQAKNFLQYQTQANELQDSLNNLAEEKKQLESALEARITQNQMLQEKIAHLQEAYDEVLLEKERLKNYTEKMEIEYRIVNETKKKITELTKQNSELLHKFKSLEDKIDSLERARLDALAEAELYRRQTRDINKKYNEAQSKNKALETEIQEIPKRFAEVSRENKVLIKQTALMHYNLGVFYMEKKEYSRAIAEIEKSIEINPDDAYAHFNLGYIYAEYLVDRAKAIEHFRQFLRLAKSDDKDVDWVKKYIITWQTWEGKKPAK